MPINTESSVHVNNKALEQALLAKGLLKGSNKWHKVAKRIKHKFLYVANTQD